MAANPTPRQIVKGLLQGVAPPRALFLPIVFSLGCRVENVSLRAFLGNPTKISNSLRRIRSYLRSDELACYFDPYLEVEALGGTLHWKNEDLPPELCWPPHANLGQLWHNLRPPEMAAQEGRTPVAVEVIRRLKSMLREECLLMVGATGPFTLASSVLGMDRDDVRRSRDFPAPAVEFTASVTAQISTKFVEAGADLVLVVEEVLPIVSAQSCDWWVSLLTPILNVIRFYEVLPILLLTDGRSVAANWEILFSQKWECVLCPTIEGLGLGSATEVPESMANGMGMAIPLELFHSHESASGDLLESIRHVVTKLQPVLLTTAGDVPATADMKRVSTLLGELRRLI